MPGEARAYAPTCPRNLIPLPLTLTIPTPSAKLYSPRSGWIAYPLNSNEWKDERDATRKGLLEVMGSIRLRWDNPGSRGALPLSIVGSERVGDLIREDCLYEAELGDKVPAICLRPAEHAATSPRAAVLCLHRSTVSMV